ncbi:MAG: GAF domain-containing protein [Bacteroidota bacterium]
MTATKFSLRQQLDHRNSELAMVNIIQAALAAKMEMQAIYDLVGDKLREIFGAADINIRIYDAGTNLMHYPYYYEGGKRLVVASSPLENAGFEAHIMRTCESLVINEDMEQAAERYGSHLMPGEHLEKSSIFMPLMVGGQARGLINLKDMENEHAYSPSDVSLLTTLASSLSVALEIARLFAETQVRFKETEILRAANLELTKSLDLDAILGTLLDFLQQLVPYDSGSVFLLEDEHRLTAVAARGYEQWVENPEKAVGVTFDFANISHIRSVIENQRTLIIPDVTRHPGWVAAKTAAHVRNWLAVPLVAGNKTIGMYSLDKVEPGYFTAEHQRLAENLAAQAAIAFQNATLFHNQQVANAQAETLRAAASALGSTLSLSAVFELILSELRKVVPYDSCSVQQLDGNEMVIVGGYGFPNLEELLGNRFDWRGPDDPAGEVVRRREAVILADVSARFEHFKEETHGHGRIRGWMGVPLLFGDRLIGMLTLDKAEEHFYTSRHARVAQAFAAQAATAIENARLFETEQLAREQAEAQGRQMAALNRVAQAVTTTLDLQTMLEIAAREMVILINARSAGVGLLNHERDALQIVAYYSRSDEPSAVGLTISLEGNIATQQVIETSESVLITDAQNTPLQDEGTRAVMRARNTHCILLLPLLARGEVIGTIAPDIDEPDRVFTPEEVQLAQTIANQMAGAIENARLFDEAQRLLEETRKAKDAAETLRAASLAFTETLNLDSILDKLLDYLELMIPYDSATIFLMEDDSGLAAHAVRGYERFVEISLAQMTRIEPNTIPRIDRIVQQQSGTIILDTTRDSSWTWVPTTMHIRSWMGVPLVAGGRTIGMYSLDKAEPNFFTPEHLHLAEALAAQAAIVIEKSQLFDSEVASHARAETQSRRLNSLNLVARAVSSTRDLNEILEIAAREIVSQMGARSCGVTLINSARTQLEVVAFAGQEGVPDTVGITIPLEGNPGTQQVIASQQPLVITDAQNSPLQSAEAREVFKARGITCMLITPLVVRDEVIGTFGPDTNEPGRVFTAGEVELAVTIARQISGAIENARLFDEIQRLLKITEERAAELSAISKVSQALVAESELDKTIELIGDEIREIFGADIVYVALLDPQTHLIHFPYQIGENFTTLRLGEGLASKILGTGEPLLINRDVNKRALEMGAMPAGREVLSYLGVPIKTSQGTIGVISVQSTAQEGIFNEDSVRLLTTIAANAGAALHNARLFSEALENLRQVAILTDAARAIENSAYEPAMVESVAARTDALGELARVFRKMAEEVRLREQRLKRQLAQLQLDIEEKKLAKAETVATYISMDRRQAMAQDKSLPEHVHGTALFADVSGFTALTESLANELGLPRGAEEMIRHINRVFTALIDEVHRYSGSVISFSGDAITCWFDDLDLNGNQRPDSSVQRAAACGLAMQKAMSQFAAIGTPNGRTIALSVKVALAAGPARRMTVGDGTAHQIDVLAGSTLSALAEAEHEAERGEVVIAAAGIPALEEQFYVADWREEKQYALLSGLRKEIAPSPWPDLAPNAIPETLIQPWMHPAVFEKVRAGQSDMLSELRPATALFMKFGGLDYDNEPEAAAQLNAFVQWVEQVSALHNGSIIQFTVGDKGSYIYIVFGAPVAHKDDAVQAVFTALELAALPESLSHMKDLYIGVASGQMRVGAYGGSTHRTYGAIGDRTNLAARLMMAASRSQAGASEGQRGTVFCNDSVYEAAHQHVEFEPMTPITVKGKSEPIAIYRPLRKLVEQDAAFGISLERAQVIDRLSPTEQLTLKVASVIGQLFTLEALSAIYPEAQTREDLQIHLQTLAALDLIVGHPDQSGSYNFKDVQTREAAYNLMLFAQRRQLHRAMAELLEQAEFQVPPYAEIAHHWLAADEVARAVQYLEKAGEHARQMGDFEEATRFFKESLRLSG